MGLELTVGEAEIAGKAHLEWRITRGQMTEVSCNAKGLSADLAVEGPAVCWGDNGSGQAHPESAGAAHTVVSTTLPGVLFPVPNSVYNKT